MTLILAMLVMGIVLGAVMCMTYSVYVGWKEEFGNFVNPYKVSRIQSLLILLLTKLRLLTNDFKGECSGGRDIDPIKNRQNSAGCQPSRAS